MTEKSTKHLIAEDSSRSRLFLFVRDLVSFGGANTIRQYGEEQQEQQASLRGQQVVVEKEQRQNN